MCVCLNLHFWPVDGGRASKCKHVLLPDTLGRHDGDHIGCAQRKAPNWCMPFPCVLFSSLMSSVRRVGGGMEHGGERRGGELCDVEPCSVLEGGEKMFCFK